MNTYEINLTFKNHEEAEKWIEENCMEDGRRKYNGEFILMICHERSVHSDEETITRICTVV